MSSARPHAHPWPAGVELPGLGRPAPAVARWSVPARPLALAGAALTGAVLLLGALAVGGPGRATGTLAGTAAVALVVALLGPGSAAGTATLLLTVLTYYVATLVGGARELPGPAVPALAAGLYLLHALLALAAALPRRSGVDPGVIVTWARRTGTVLGLALPVVGVSTLLSASPGGFPARAAGLLAALAALAVPVGMLLARRPG